MTQKHEAIKQNMSGHDGFVSIVFFVSAGSREEKLLIRPDNNLGIKVRAPALENKANERVIQLLSEWLKIPKSSICIAKGAHAKRKELIFKNISFDYLLQKIDACLEEVGYRS